jgi:hypothetical protein
MTRRAHHIVNTRTVRSRAAALGGYAAAGHAELDQGTTR